MSLIRMEIQDHVAVVKLDHGVTNAINLPLVNELTEVLRQAKRDSNVRGLVLTSANDKFFSIGLNLPELYGLPKDEFAVFFRAFARAGLELFTLPKPTVAALTGHALAGGCIMALCCDYRVMAAGRKLMGLNEIKLGVPVPYLADCILRHLVGVRTAREVTDTGEFYPPEELLRMGLVDQVLPSEQVLPWAIEKARTLGAYPPAAFAGIKRNRVQPVEAQVLAQEEEEERLFLNLWYGDEARARLKAALEKF
jgi:enoyl-CoA hydratase/carnithine racemase